MQYKAVLVDFTQENKERKVVSQRKHYLRLKESLMHKITFPICCQVCPDGNLHLESKERIEEGYQTG